MSKWLSRKWITQMLGVVLGIGVMMGFVAGEEVPAVMEAVVGAVMVVASALGFTIPEAINDAKRVGQEKYTNE